MASNNKPTSKVFTYDPDEAKVSRKIHNMCDEIAAKLLKDKDANPKLYAQYDQGSYGGVHNLASDIYNYFNKTRKIGFYDSMPDYTEEEDEDAALIERELMNYENTAKPVRNNVVPTTDSDTKDTTNSELKKNIKDIEDFFDKNVTRDAGGFSFGTTADSAPAAGAFGFGLSRYNPTGFSFSFNDTSHINSVLTTPNDGAVNNLLNNVLFVELMSSTGTLPTKKSKDDAGWDLYSADDYTVPAWGSVLVSTQLKMSLPPNHYGRIASRSGLALNSNIEVGAGVIDRSYQGEIKVLLRNFSDVDYSVKAKDRIAQFILSPYNTASIACVNSITEVFGASDRGAGGFGSTGK